MMRTFMQAPWAGALMLALAILAAPAFAATQAETETEGEMEMVEATELETRVPPPTPPAPANAPDPFAFLSGAAPAATDRSGDWPDGEARISNIFFDSDIREALDDVATQAGVTIIVAPDVHGFVSMELNNATLEDALDLILAGSGAVVKKLPRYYLVASSDPLSPSFNLVSDVAMIKLNNLPAVDAMSLLADGLAPYVKADPNTNQLAVTAPQSIIDRIRSDIAVIDQPVRQVMLEARIVVMEKEGFRDLGLRWDWPTAQFGAYSDWERAGGFGLPTPPGPLFPWAMDVGYSPGKEFTNSLMVTLNLLQLNNEATVLANPRIMTQDGKEATVNVSLEEYFEILTRGYYTQSQMEKIDAGTTLKITPRIGQEGQISLELETEVSDVVARGGNNLPMVTRRIATTTVRIQDGGTAVVAGLKDHRFRSALEETPYFSRLPLVGLLFRNKSDTVGHREVAMFVTAYIVDESGQATNRARVGERRFSPVGRDFDDELQRSLLRLGIAGEGR